MARALLLTRARPQALEFAERVVRRSLFEPLIAPMQEMRNLDVRLDLTGVTSLVFTSKNGVAAFLRLCDTRDLPCYCVGEATATAARNAGMNAVAAKGSVDSMAPMINDKSGALHLRGVHGSGDLGIKSIAIYEQVALPLSDVARDLFSQGQIDAVALFSPRSARLLAECWDNWPIRPGFFCISAATATPVRMLGDIHICALPSADSMLDLLAEQPDAH